MTANSSSYHISIGVLDPGYAKMNETLFVIAMDFSASCWKQTNENKLIRRI